jgi:hypothetical protein
MRKNLTITAAAIAMLFLMVGCPAKGPKIEIKSPADNASVSLGNITIKAVATAEQGMNRVEFWIDNTVRDTETTSNADTFSYIWNAANATLGAHSIVAKAYDEKDESAQDSIKITIIAGGNGPTYHSGAIDTNETWWPSGNPHIIQGDVYAQNNATLTIKPGCIVKFDEDNELYCGYNSSGAIVAEGTADSTITFTSNVATPAAGDWKSVSAYSNAMSTTSFKYCIFEYGGQSSYYGAFYVGDANIKFSNSTVRKSENNGIVVTTNGKFAQFGDNTVTDCNGYAISIYPEYVRTLGAGNTFSNNTNNAILIKTGSVTTTGTWLNQGIPYVVAGDVAVADAANNPTLTIKPGCVIKFDVDVEFYCGYNDPGAIIAEGTSDSTITFTSNVSTPSAGDWKSVSAYQNAMSTTSFKYCIFEYGGQSSYYGAFYVNDANIKFSNSTVRKSGNDGIIVTTNAKFAQFTNNTIADCNGYAMSIYPEYVRTLGAGNTFTNNLNNAIRVRTGQVSTTGTWLNQSVPYVIEGDVSVEDDINNPILTIAAGTTVKLQSDVEFYVGYNNPGGLIADGTSGWITFTSAIPSPSRGDWKHLSFYDNSIDAQCKLLKCKIEYGGSNEGNVYVSEALPEIKNDSIGHSNTYGIYLAGTASSVYPDPDSLIANNTFYDNTSGSVRVPPPK